MSSILFSGAALAFALLVEPLPASAPLQSAPVNPHFLSWLARHPRRGAPGPLGGTEEGGQRTRGYLPHPMDLSHLHGPFFTRGAGDPPFPARFDLRATGLLTPVKDQGPYGTCWTFACLASLESSLLAAGQAPLNLSEWQLAWYAYTPFNASLLTSFTPGPLWAKADEVFDQGGDDLMSTALLARGTAPVAERDCPYHDGPYRHGPRPGGDLPDGREEVRASLEAAYYLYLEDMPASAEDLKCAVSRIGPAVIAMDWEDADYDSAQGTYRNITATVDDLNHEVAIVGWDDTFEPCRFPAANRPSAPGAWIVRNCWGRAWGQHGCFYLSYDSKLFDGTVFVGGHRSFHRIHQADPLGWCGSRGYGRPTATCANVFEAPGPERITAVSFYAGAVGASFEVGILPFATEADLTDGTRPLRLAQKGTLQAPGYHLIPLDAPVEVPRGRFAVVLKLTTPGYDYPIPIQQAYAGYSDQAVYEHGRSFISPDGVTWEDLAPACQGAALCLKAFAERE